VRERERVGMDKGVKGYTRMQETFQAKRMA
jgi:hypothetical protein